MRSPAKRRGLYMHEWKVAVRADGIYEAWDGEDTVLFEGHPDVLAKGFNTTGRIRAKLSGAQNAVRAFIREGRKPRERVAR